jgi:hypothetical protein
MPALNFKAQFADAVATGTKRQTIRAERKRPFKKGDKLYLYTGMRTSACRKLGEAVAAVVKDISIGDGGAVAICTGGGHFVLQGEDLERFARRDGFDSTEAFLDFFRTTHGLPFLGQLIMWEEVTHE